MALTLTDLDSIRAIIQEELDNRFSSFINDYSVNGYPSIDSSLNSYFSSFMNDYSSNGYPIVPYSLGNFLGDYDVNGYPSSGGSVDLTPIQSDLTILKGFTDTVEASLTSIKTKTDTISSVNLSPLQTVLDAIKLKTDTITPTDLSGVLSGIDLIKTKTDLNLDAKVSSLYPQISSLLSDPSAMTGLDFFNLDGNFGSFPNGSVVHFLDRILLADSYTVEKSYFFRNDTNQFLIMYTLVDSLGNRTVAPHISLGLGA